jgi:dolichyl-phosphate-mannose--protein O-mannosyl transferase
VLDCGTGGVLHVHVPDSLLGVEWIGGWGWVYEFRVSTYPQGAWDGRYFCWLVVLTLSCLLLNYELDVGFGSIVTLRHVNTQGGYLHSHAHPYQGGSQRESCAICSS